MISKLVRNIFLPLMGMIIFGCSIISCQTSMGEVPGASEIPSFHEMYSILENAAKLELDDPKMDLFSIQYKEYASEYNVKAIFFENYHDGEFISISIRPNLSIEINRITSEFVLDLPSRNKNMLEGIVVTDDILDSSRAWEIFFSKQLVKRNRSQCFEEIFLLLMHGTMKSEEIIYWRLVLRESEGECFKVYEIDGYTGEFIQVDE
jgi:hypothetical protein